MKVRRHITRRRLKWAGLVASVVLLVVFIASTLGSIYYLWYTPTASRGVFLGWGGIGAGITYDDGKYRGQESSGLFFETNQRTSMPHYWWFQIRILHPIPSVTGPMRSHFMVIPLWFPLLLVALPTARLWYLDRPVKPWQCGKCRYDLRGLEDESGGGGEEAVCPECGEKHE